MSTISAGTTVTTALVASGDTTGALTFQVNGTTTAATITSAGDVGIGIASPGARLRVVSKTNVNAPVLGSATNYPVFLSNTDSAYGLGIGVNASDGHVWLQAQRSDSAATAYNITLNEAGGNVGIGTSTMSGRMVITDVNRITDNVGMLNLYTTNAASANLGASLGLGGATGQATSPYVFATIAGRYEGSGYLGYLQLCTTGTGGAVTERMRITSGGELLVGVTTATNNSRLKVQGSSTSSADYMVQFTNSSAQNAFYIKNDRTVFSDGVYNSTTASAGNVFIDGAAQLLRSTSSLRYKHDVNNATHGLADVLKLRSVTYKGINDGDKVFGGLIAEEVHDAGLTEFVAYDKEGQPDALHYGNMVALAFKAIQELKAENDALKARIEALETK